LGNSKIDALSRFFIGSTSREVVAKADCPVLLVPVGTDFQALKNIVFATDLNKTDIVRIDQLSELAKIFNAKLTVSHIERGNDKVEQLKFINEMIKKTHYPDINFATQKNSDVDVELQSENFSYNADMLVLVHRKRGILETLFQGSHTQKVAQHISIPLLVYPAKKSHMALPVF